MFSELKRSLSRVVDLSLILGIAGTVAFYGVVLQPSMHGTILHRYTTEHPVEYVIVMMFIWGLVDIALKTLSFPRELLALRDKWLPPRTGRVPVSIAGELLSAVRSRPRWLVESRMGERIAKVLEHVVENGHDEEYRDHVKYLADKAYDETHGRYSLVRFVIMVSPILGFLGTVVHFGTALTGMSADDISNQLPSFVAEMGEAFNTTTVALATSMAMMFGLFLCERFEHSIDRTIDRYVEHELLNRFEIQQENLSPFLGAIRSANNDAMRLLASTLEQQGELSAQSFEAMCQRIEERHSSELQKFLKDVALLRNDVKDLGATLRSISDGEGKLVELQHELTTNLQVLHETHQIDEALHSLAAAIHLLTTRHRQGGPDSLAA